MSSNLNIFDLPIFLDESSILIVYKINNSWSAIPSCDGNDDGGTEYYLPEGFQLSRNLLNEASISIQVDKNSPKFEHRDLFDYHGEPALSGLNGEPIVLKKVEYQNDPNN